MSILLDAFFPPSDELRLVREVRAEDVRNMSNVQNVNGSIFLLRFEQKIVRALIHEAKFHANKRAFAILGMVLKKYIQERAGAEETMLIPIPLSSVRMRDRGYNQVTEIVRCSLNELPNLSLNTTALRRVRDTRPQTELRREERLTNMSGAFMVTDPERVRGRHIVLIDDVITTGATLRAAKAALLLHAPASVTCVALAH